MASADEVIEALETALENTYKAMQPEIDEFVLEFDANIEENVRVLYKVLSKYFVNFIEPKMVHDFWAEMRKLENVSKEIEGFFKLLYTNDPRTIDQKLAQNIYRMFYLVVMTSEEWVLS